MTFLEPPLHQFLQPSHYQRFQVASGSSENVEEPEPRSRSEFIPKVFPMGDVSASRRSCLSHLILSFQVARRVSISKIKLNPAFSYIPKPLHGSQSSIQQALPARIYQEQQHKRGQAGSKLPTAVHASIRPGSSSDLSTPSPYI